MRPVSPLLAVLRDGAVVEDFSARQWTECVRDAERNKLLSTLACRLESARRLELAPDNIRLRLEGALRAARGSRRSTRWEVRKIHAALAGAGLPFALLKGAAYELAELPPAVGRLYVDIDILVRREDLSRAERALFEHGWISTKLDAYDQRYYRQWMHEIPPLHHTRRSTSLDVHHTILPPTASLNPDPVLLWAEAQELASWPGMFVLGPLDMVLHSAVHLFHDGDLDRGLRDLVDLDGLLRHLAPSEGFWDRLLSRAGEQDLVRPLFYALRYCSMLLGTPVPALSLRRAAVFAGLPPLTLPLMDRLVLSALDPGRPNLDSRAASLSRWLLYLRSHYLRMPPHLLLPHLVRKALVDER